jgi:hypothetical protein
MGVHKTKNKTQHDDASHTGMVLCHQDLAFAIPFAKRVFWMGEKPMNAFNNEVKTNYKYVDTLVPQPIMHPTAKPRGCNTQTPVPQPRVLRTPTLPPYVALYGEQFDFTRPARFHSGVDAFNAVVAGARICFFVQIVRRSFSRTPTTAMVHCKQEPWFRSIGCNECSHP